MSVVRLEGLTIGVAEEAVALVWRELVEHDIVTPRMAVMRRSDIAVRLSFRSSDDADRVAAALRRAAFGCATCEQAS